VYLGERAMYDRRAVSFRRSALFFLVGLSSLAVGAIIEGIEDLMDVL
jgi:hypothetical protein